MASIQSNKLCLLNWRFGYLKTIAIAIALCRLSSCRLQPGFGIHRCGIIPLEVPVWNARTPRALFPFNLLLNRNGKSESDSDRLDRNVLSACFTSLRKKKLRLKFVLINLAFEKRLFEPSGIIQSICNKAQLNCTAWYRIQIASELHPKFGFRIAFKLHHGQTHIALHFKNWLSLNDDYGEHSKVFCF